MISSNVLPADEGFDSSDGVSISGTGSTGNVVEGNDIGTDRTGENPLPNGYAGVQISFGASDNTIGGPTAGARNVISDNGYFGVFMNESVTDNTVEGNYIGTDAMGTSAMPNGEYGVEMTKATNNMIGGTAAGAGNVISGNLYSQVDIFGSGTSGNTLEGNYIGTDDSGTTMVAGGYYGVSIDYGAADDTIGGTTAGARNVISGNAIDGVDINSAGVSSNDPGTSGNVVEGNYIGTDVTGTQPLGNGSGVEIYGGTSDNTIGGTSSGAANLIADNSGVGVFVGNNNTDAAIDNAILNNSIYGNGGLGIDLGNDGVTPNHSSPSAGLISGAPNGDQNFPVIASATFVPDVSDSNGTLIVSGSLSADFNTTYIIQLFANQAADRSGFGQGQTLIASFDVATDGSGNKVFSTSLASTNLTGESISATATDPNFNTSEFAQDVTVVAGTGSSVTVPAGGSAAATAAALQQVVSELQSLPSGTTPPSVVLQVTSVSELDSVIAAINGVSSQAQPPVTVIVDLGGQTYQADTTLNAPSGIHVVVQNGTLAGGSPRADRRWRQRNAQQRARHQRDQRAHNSGERRVIDGAEQHDRRAALHRRSRIRGHRRHARPRHHKLARRQHDQHFHRHAIRSKRDLNFCAGDR